jgi:hypothetical protein
VGYTIRATHLRHPDVGEIYLTRTKLDLPNTGGAHIITWHAPPNSTSAWVGSGGCVGSWKSGSTGWPARGLRQLVDPGWVVQEKQSDAVT